MTFSGVSTGSASGLDRCATGGLLAGGGMPREVYTRTLFPFARRSAHGRCPLRVSRAAPPPASCQPRASAPLRPRRPEKTPLHKIVSEHLESWLEWRDQAERPVPGYVEEELRGYLEKSSRASHRE